MLPYLEDMTITDAVMYRYTIIQFNVTTLIWHVCLILRYLDFLYLGDIDIQKVDEFYQDM